MNPELKSILTTVLAVALGSVATWLVKSGIITADQTDAFVQGGIGVLLAVGAAGVAWLKSRDRTPAAQIADIKKMSISAANTAVESLPTTAKNAIKLATMTPTAIVNAAAALPDITKIEVASDAAPALSAIAENPGQPKVVSQIASK